MFALVFNYVSPGVQLPEAYARDGEDDDVV